VPVVLPGSRLTGALTVKGVIKGTEDLLIDARVEGTVHLVGATALIGTNGSVAANVTDTQILVDGDVQGDLLAAERIRIGATGKTKGSISARRISVDPGGEIHGAVEVRRDDESVPRPMIPSTEHVAVPQPVPAATSLAKEPSAAA
jgi:cytoskeletal protein CcmA (bactofilin family)